MKKIVVFDFSGTILKKEIPEEASKRRLAWLGKKVSKTYLRKALAKDAHYKLNKKLLSIYTGIKDDKLLTIFSTNLFKIHMLALAKEKKQGIFRPGILDVIRKLRRKYKIAITSGIRTDIIFSMLLLTKTNKLIDYICAQNPSLDFSNSQLLNCVIKLGTIAYVIGDKLTDIQAAAKKPKIKTIFLKGGHPLGREEKQADFVAEKPSDILKIIK